MRHTRPLRRLLGRAWIAGCLALGALGACDGRGTDADSSPAATDGPSARPRPPAAPGAATDPVHAAIERARAFLAARPRDTTGSLLFLDLLHRRFGLEEFAGMLAEYDRLAAGMPRPAPDVLSSRRLLDAGTRIEPELLRRLVSKVNRITHPALHAREVPLPGRYANRLARAADAGGYELTHAGLALVWLAEHGRTDVVDEAFVERVARDMAALLQPADGTSDLEIEAATFLHALSRGELVPTAFIDAVLDAQLPDGGWPADPAAPDEPNDHTSALALWLLLEASTPVAEKGPTLAR